MRRAVVVSILALVPALLIASPGYAPEVPPAPSALSNEGVPPPPGWVDVEGEDGLLADALYIGLDPMPASGGGATCTGCYAHNNMGWHDHWWYEHVRADHSQNHAGEVISRQNAHSSLQSSTTSDCYDDTATLHWNEGTGDQLNRQTGSAMRSTDENEHGWKAWSDKWLMASGHNWFDDGGHWALAGEIDICKQF